MHINIYVLYNIARNGGVAVPTAPRLMKELDFRVIKEEWLTIKLEDGSIVKFKPVLVKVFETDAKDPTTGELILSLEGHNIVTVRSPENIQGKPSEYIPPVPEALKMPKEEVGIVETIDPSWNIYELESGKRIKTKAVVTSIYKIKNIFDKHGNPYYIVMSQVVVGSSPMYMPPYAAFNQIIDTSVLNYLQLLGFQKFEQLRLPPDWRVQTPSLETLKRLTPLIVVKLSEDVLTPLDEKLFARKTADGKIEIFEVIE